MIESHKTLRVTGLRHHVIEWSASSDLPPIVLLHGWMDSAASFCEVARILHSTGRRMLAIDLRGYGQTSHIPAEASYYFTDYVRDLDAVLAAEDVAAVDLVGHSMGGTVATLFAGAFPERVRRLVLVEGLGPGLSDLSDAPARTRRWIEAMKRERRAPRPMTASDVLASLQRNHPRVPVEVLAGLVPTFAACGDDGSYAWRADPGHRDPSPLPFNRETFLAHARAITAPTLFVSGGSTGWHPTDEAERIAELRQVETVTIDDGGHMLHWTKPVELAATVGAFLARP